MAFFSAKINLTIPVAIVKTFERLLSQTIALDCFSLFVEKIDGLYQLESRSMWVPSRVRRKIVPVDGVRFYRVGSAARIRADIIKHSGVFGWERKKAIDCLIMSLNKKAVAVSK